MISPNTAIEIDGPTANAVVSEIAASIRAIASAWQSGISQTMELARTVAHARRQLSRGQWSNLWKAEDMPFAKRKGEMLVVIGERLNWANAQTFAHLPAQWTILYELARLPRKLIERLIDANLIHPKLTLKEARALVGGRVSTSEPLQNEMQRRSGQFRRWLRSASTGWTSEQCESAQELLKDLHKIVAAAPENPVTHVAKARIL